MSKKRRKHKELLPSRIKRLKTLSTIDPCDKDIKPPADSIPADHSKLAHNNTYSPLPIFYVDKLVVCRECGAKEVWTAEQQKWWYEVAKGNINSIAVKCRSCRKKDNERRAAARRIHSEGIAGKSKHDGGNR
jgi:hypothetical protein